MSGASSNAPNQFNQLATLYSQYYVTGAKIRLRFGYESSLDGLGALNNIHYGVTAACINNGTQVPALTLAGPTLWGEAQYTKHKMYNKDAGGTNTIEMYIPTSTFSSMVGNQADWAATSTFGTGPSR